MGIWINIGARDESDTENGLSHFIEHMLFKGTEKRSAYQIAKEFDAIGGQTNAFTSMENTCYHAKVMYSKTDAMIDILADIFLNSVFDEAEIEKERPVIFQEISSIEDNPEDYIHVLSSNSYWGDNALGRSVLGTKENIIRFDSKTLKNFFSNSYNPDKIVIAASGNLDHNHLVDILGPAFEKMKSGTGPQKRITPVGCHRLELNYKDLEQTHICISTKGLSVTDPRRFALSVLNIVLGGNMSSRLFQEIREKRGLAYSVYSYASSYIDIGMFGIYTGTDPDSAKTAVELILKEMRNLKNTGIGSIELSDAKEYIKGSILLSTESIDNQMIRLAQNEIHFRKEISLKEVLGKIEKVTEDDILGLAQNLFDKNYLSLTILGPLDNKKTFEDILAL